jgi:hypothetical protein
MNKYKTYKAGSLYKVLEKWVAKWHPNTFLSSDNIFVEPSVLQDYLPLDEIIMFLGITIGPDGGHDILHKVLCRDQIFYIWLNEPNISSYSHYSKKIKKI